MRLAILYFKNCKHHNKEGFTQCPTQMMALLLPHTLNQSKMFDIIKNCDCLSEWNVWFNGSSLQLSVQLPQRG